MNSSKIMAIAASGIVVSIAAGAGFLFFNDNTIDCPVKAGTGTVDVGGAFTLTDHNGVKASVPEVFDGKPALVYFGYTYCPDFCPNDLGRITRVVEDLEKDNIDIKPVFITVDPKRDTQEVIKFYSEHFHPDMSILRGNDAETAAAAKAYRVYYAETPDENFSDGYMISHSTLTYFMDKSGNFLEFFRTDQTDEQMKNGITCALRG